MPLTSQVQVRVTATETGVNAFGGPNFTPTVRAAYELANGVGAGQADIVWAAQRSVATAANDDIDLAGVLAGAFGNTLSLVKIVAVLIINAPISGAANTTNLTVGAGSNPVVGWLGGTTPTIGPIRPGGFLLRAESDLAGVATVTAATGDIFRVANSAGATAVYQIVVIGRSA